MIFFSFNSEYLTYKIYVIVCISHVGTWPWQWSAGLYVHLMDQIENKPQVCNAAKEGGEST